MSDLPADPTSASAPPPPEPEHAPRKKKRTWLKIAGVILLLLILLIVFLPAIASTGPIRSFAVSKINENLNGEVEVSDWSIGWTSGVDVEGIKVLDDQGVTVLTISRVRVPLSLIDAARGNYALGDVLIERPELVKLVIHEDGSTNLERLVKSEPGAAKQPDDGPSELPDVSGRITIKELRGSIFRGDGPPVVVIQPSDIVVAIPDINGTITNDVKLALAGAGGKTGTISLVGSVDAIENNQVASDKLAAEQTLELAQLDTAALAPLLKLADVDATLAGIGNGKLEMKVAAGTDVSANGELRFDNFAFGGPILSGDAFKSAALRIPVQVTSASKDGVTRVTAKDTGVHFDQGSVVVSADAPLDAIQNAAAQKPPGRDGTLAVDVKIPKLADLANQMPNTLKLVEGVKLTEGSLSQVLNVTLTKDATALTSTLDLKDVKGTKDGKPLRPLDPVHLAAGATSYGGMDLRKLALKLTSGFADAQGGGESLANLTLTSNIDLKKLREQAGQFTDALDVIESGTGTIALTTNGDPTKENALIATALGVELRDLHLVQPATQPAQQATPILREPWLKLGVSGNVQRGTRQFVQAVNDLVVTLQTNDPKRPTIDLEASADVARKPEGVTAPTFTLAKLNVDIPAARNEFRAFLAALDETGLEPTAGRVALNNPMEGSYDGKNLTIAPEAPLSLVVANVTMQKTDPASRAKSTPIDNRTVRVDAAGTFDVGGEGFAAKVSKLALVEDRKLLSITKSDEGELVVRIPPGGTPQGSGTLLLSADLVGLNQIAAAFGSPIVERRSDGSMDLQSGLLAGKVALNAAERESRIDGTFDVSNLTLTTSAEPIRNEKLTATVNVTSPASGETLTGRLNLASSFVNAAVENLNLLLTKQAGGGATTRPAVWEMVRGADVNADVASLPKAYALYSALVPATQPSSASVAPASGSDVIGRPPAKAELANAQGKPEPPLNITAGSAKLALKLARQGNVTNVNLSEARIRDLAFNKGDGAFKSPRDMVISLDAALDAVDSIRQINVTKLAGDLAVATATLEQPLVITNLDTTPSANGQVKVEGRIEEIARLLEALDGTKPGEGYPYAGQLVMSQRVSNQSGGVALSGNVRATDFVVFQQGTATPAFTEKQLDLTQEVMLDMAAKRAAVKQLALDMASSGAMKLNVVGGLTDWAAARKLDENTRLDLTYDLAKLWPIIKPLVAKTPEDFKDLVIAGQGQREFTFSGSYPATDAAGRDLDFHESIKSLVATGGLTVQKFSYMGIDVLDLELPITLDKGLLITQYRNRPKDKRFPPVAKCNGGTINLGGVVVDLGSETPLLTIGKNQKLLLGVSMNPLLADSVLGKFINPAFVDPKEARGLIDVVLTRCENVPLGELITRRNDGKVDFQMSIREVNIGNAFLNNLVARLKPNAFNEGAVQANIRDAQLSIANGILSQNMVFSIDKVGLHFDGKVRLADQALLPLNLKIPTELLNFDDNLRRYIPAEIVVPITGTTIAPKWNLDVVVQNLAVEAGKKALLGNVLERAGGGGGGRAPQPGSATQPAPQDPVGGLLENILGGRKREEERTREEQPSGSDRISQPRK